MSVEDIAFAPHRDTLPETAHVLDGAAQFRRENAHMSTIVELTPDIEQRLEALAAHRAQQNASSYRTSSPRAWRTWRTIIRPQVLKRVQQGQERVYSAEAVRRELGFAVEYTETALAALRKLDKPVARRIMDYLDAHIVGQDAPRTRQAFARAAGWAGAIG